MPLAITPELEAILVSRLQVGQSGFRGRIEIDWIENLVVAGAEDADWSAGTVNLWTNIVANLPTNWFDGSDGTIYSCLQGQAKFWCTVSLQYIEQIRVKWNGSAQSSEFYIEWSDDVDPDFLPVALGGGANNTIEGDLGGTWHTAIHAVYGTGFGGGAGTRGYYDAHGVFVAVDWSSGYTHADYTFDTGGVTARLWRFRAPNLRGNSDIGTVSAAGSGSETVETVTHTEHYQVGRISIDKSLQMQADQLTVEIDENATLPHGWGPDSVYPTGCQIRVFQWYGDPANEVQDFDGLIDAFTDARDNIHRTIKARDRMAILIDQSFSTVAPQGADEDGAVRTPANGVYLSMEVSAIVEDIVVNQAGWPSGSVDITPTSYVLDEFIVRDGSSWASAIIGKEQLTGLVGYSAWADELGVFHFGPTVVSQPVSEPLTPSYTFQAGIDITSLSDETQQYDLRTRVKVRGPLTTQTLSDTWLEQWRTNAISKPVGIWYDPTEPDVIRVVDRGTKRMYKVRQSDRVVVSSVYLGGVVAYPLGLSGDPADISVYYVLNAGWFFGNSAVHEIKKIRKSDNVVLATLSLPTGEWSSIKASSANMFASRLDTDRVYARSKTDGSALYDFTHTVDAVTQLNPSGLMVDGTKVHVFWYNAGNTPRFLVCDESDPGTVEKIITTSGVTLVGGEMDTTTHTECYGGSDLQGLVAKFTLVAVSEQTDEVWSEVIDTELEDELGALAGLEPREHDAHPDDADHAWLARRETITLDLVTSLAQATQTAQLALAALAQRHRTLDVGILGNPALQKTDLVRVEDLITGISSDFIIDTYRSAMDQTYLGTLALLPVTVPTDAPTDEGDAT